MAELNGRGMLGEDQELDDLAARAMLRERFLRLISHLSGGEKCRLRLFDHSDYTCQVRGFNPNFESVIVENLSTPYPQPIPKAIIRTSDVISMHFEVDSLDKYKY